MPTSQREGARTRAVEGSAFCRDDVLAKSQTVELRGIHFLNRRHLCQQFHNFSCFRIFLMNFGPSFDGFLARRRLMVGWRYVKRGARERKRNAIVVSFGYVVYIHTVNRSFLYILSSRSKEKKRKNRVYFNDKFLCLRTIQKESKVFRFAFVSFS